MTCHKSSSSALFQHFLASAFFCLFTANFAFAQETGFIPPTEKEFSDIELRSPYFGAGFGPTTANLSRFFPDPMNQGSQESCIGFAFAYGMMTALETIEERRFVTPYSPSYVYNASKHSESPGKCGPVKLEPTKSQLLNHGTPTIEDFPYNPSQCDKVDNAGHRFTKTRRFKNIERLNGPDAIVKAVPAARDALAAGKPVFIGMPIGKDFKNYKSGYYPSNFQTKNGATVKGGFSTTEYHAMVLVGFDEDRDAFRVFNSHGPEWGSLGFGWVNFDHVKRKDIWLFTGELEQPVYQNISTVAFGSAPSPIESVSEATMPEAKEALIGSPAFGSGNSDPAIAPPSEPILEATPIPVFESDPQPVFMDISSESTSFENRIKDAIRGTVGQTAEGQTKSGMDYYPVSVWLQLPKNDLALIDTVEYHWEAPSFISPKRPQKGSRDSFLVQYLGYGAVNRSKISIKLKNGDHYLVDYPFSSLWNYGSLNETDKADTTVSLNPPPLPKCPEGTSRQGFGVCLGN